MRLDFNVSSSKVRNNYETETSKSQSHNQKLVLRENEQCIQRTVDHHEDSVKMHRHWQHGDRLLGLLL